MSNIGQKNRLYHNNGDGTFTDVAEDLGVTRPIASFPVWFWDYDNDGSLDLLVTAYGGVRLPPGRVLRGGQLSGRKSSQPTCPNPA